MHLYIYIYIYIHLYAFIYMYNLFFSIKRKEKLYFIRLNIYIILSEK